MSQFVSRPIAIFDVPVSTDIAILRPEQVLLRFSKVTTLDVGALCYLERDSVSVRRNSRQCSTGDKVILSSLCLKRTEFVRSLIAHISNEVEHWKRPTTMVDATTKIATFINWADANDYSHFFLTQEATVSATRAYAAFVRDRVASHSITLNSGVALQRVTINHIGELCGIENLGKGFNLLRMDSRSVTATPPPNEVDQARTLGLCDALFSGLSSSVLEGAPYPFALTMPVHLGYPQNTMWVFPSQAWCMPPSKLHRSSQEFRRGGFDYRTGRLVTADEILASKRVDRKKRVNGVVGQARALLDNANRDPCHRHRKFLGVIALNAFIHLFISRTGINWAQATEMEWTGSNKEASSTIRQKFRNIKFRAGGAEVFYQLPLTFMRNFHQFLRLRDYLLKDHPNFHHLFFNLGINSVGKPGRIKTAMPGIATMLKRIDPTLVPIASRAWRAAKSDWVITRADVSTAALLLQNSESTIRKSYAAGSQESHRTEMSACGGQVISDTTIGSCAAIFRS